jgi:hypothetical protein
VSDVITIDGTTYDVPILSIDVKADVLDKFAERTADGELHREVIGVYYNYTVVFGAKKNTADYIALWQKLTEPEEFHTVIMPDEDGTAEFEAYFAGVKHQFVRVGETDRFLKGLSVNVISRSPARTP